MLTLGGDLKKRELLSARLGDVLSSIYLASCVLKHFENQGRRATDLPLVEWSVRTLMYQAQEALHAFLRNLPNRWAAWFLRIFIFPRGRTYSAPSDEIGMKRRRSDHDPGEARERLSEFAYTTLEDGNPLGCCRKHWNWSIECGPLEKRLRQARKEGLIKSDYLGTADRRSRKGHRSSARHEANELRDYHEKVTALLDVDDFAHDEFRTASRRSQRRQGNKRTQAASHAQGRRLPTTNRGRGKSARGKKKAGAKKKAAKKTAKKKDQRRAGKLQSLTHGEALTRTD